MAPPSWCRALGTYLEILPSTWRHHHKVVRASVAEVRAITVKGSAESTVNRTPDTPAAIANAAVLEVA